MGFRALGRTSSYAVRVLGSRYSRLNVLRTVLEEDQYTPRPDSEAASQSQSRVPLRKSGLDV